jgi:hypothetical protein
MKKCKKCNNEFEPRGNKGSEQIYCSQDCRQKAGIERYKQRLINSNNYNNDNKPTIELQMGTNQNESSQHNTLHGYNNGRNFENIRGQEFEYRNQSGLYNEHFGNEWTGNYRGNEHTRRDFDFNRFIALIEENAKLRAENTILTQKVTNLEAELLEYELEEDMEEEEQPGFLGNIMNAYKQDPTTTVLFAKDMVLEFLKPKQQTTPKTPQ